MLCAAWATMRLHVGTKLVCVSAQGSPTDSNPSQETYRHALATSTMRPASDGTPYLYTLNLSCPEKLWTELQAEFQKSIDSFRLVATTQVSSGRFCSQMLDSCMCMSPATYGLRADVFYMALPQSYVAPDVEPWRFF